MTLKKLQNFKGTSADAIYLTFVRVLTAISSIICIKIVSVEFSLDEYGTYAQAILISTTLTSLLILGMTDGVNYFFNRGKDSEGNKASYISTIFALQIFLGILGGILILAASPKLTEYFDNVQLKPLYLWIAFQPLLTNLLAMYQNLYISIGKARLIVARNLVLSIARIGIFCVAGFFTKSIFTIVSACFIFDLAQTLYFTINLRRFGVKIKPSDADIKKVRSILGYCIPMATFVFMNALLRDMDKWIVGLLGNTEELAIYTNASKVLPFDMLTISYATILIPVVTRLIGNSQQQVAKIYGEYLNLSFITTSILVCPAIIYSKDLLVTLYSEKYLAGLYVFIIYLVVDLIRFANVSLLFSATAKTKALIGISIITLVCNAILAIPFYYIFGITGPAMASLLAIVLSYTLFIYGGSKILNCSLFKLFNYKQIARLFFEIFICAGIGLFIYSRVEIASPILEFIIFYSFTVLILAALSRKEILAYIRNLNAIR